MLVVRMALVREETSSSLLTTEDLSKEEEKDFVFSSSIQGRDRQLPLSVCPFTLSRKSPVSLSLSLGILMLYGLHVWFLFVNEFYSRVYLRQVWVLLLCGVSILDIIHMKIAR